MALNCPQEGWISTGVDLMSVWVYHIEKPQPIAKPTNTYMAVRQNQWYHFGVGAPPILV